MAICPCSLCDFLPLSAYSSSELLYTLNVVCVRPCIKLQALPVLMGHLPSAYVTHLLLCPRLQVWGNLVVSV